MSQGGVTQPAPVGLQTQLGVLERVAAVLVQQLTALGQTAEVRQGQVAQYQLNELRRGDGEKGSEEEGRKKYKYPSVSKENIAGIQSKMQNFKEQNCREQRKAVWRMLIASCLLADRSK